MKNFNRDRDSYSQVIPGQITTIKGLLILATVIPKCRNKDWDSHAPPWIGCLQLLKFDLAFRIWSGSVWYGDVHISFSLTSNEYYPRFTIHLNEISAPFIEVCTECCHQVVVDLSNVRVHLVQCYWVWRHPPLENFRRIQCGNREGYNIPHKVGIINTFVHSVCAGMFVEWFDSWFISVVTWIFVFWNR